MKEKTCCFTGHRTLPPEQIPFIKQKLEKEISLLIDKGYLYFGTGGALGFDTLAAKTILFFKNDHPKIKLILVLPCLSQTLYWNTSEKKEYDIIKQKADKIVYTSQTYTRECMYKRNRHLVHHSSVCIAYLTKNWGGTAYTVAYAKSQGVSVINIADSNIL